MTDIEKEADDYSKTVKCEWENDTYWVDCYDEITDAYIAGAKSREKRIAELKHQLAHRNCVDCSNHSSKLRKRTLELEKENAELKKEVETVKEMCCGNGFCPYRAEISLSEVEK